MDGYVDAADGDADILSSKHDEVGAKLAARRL